MRKKNMSVNEQIVEMIQGVTVNKRTISPDDELYYDLRIYGDDLYDLICSIASEFEVDFSGLNVNKYAPGEGTTLLRPFIELFGLRTYRSLTVRDIQRATQAGSWKPGSS